jgi:hypothetical protein
MMDMPIPLDLEIHCDIWNVIINCLRMIIVMRFWKGN